MEIVLRGQLTDVIKGKLSLNQWVRCFLKSYYDKLMKLFIIFERPFLSWEFIFICQPDPPENCHLTVKKLSKTWKNFFFLIDKNFHFLTKLPMAILLKKTKFFVNFFEKNVTFLAIF